MRVSILTLALALLCAACSSPSSSDSPFPQDVDLPPDMPEPDNPDLDAEKDLPDAATEEPDLKDMDDPEDIRDGNDDLQDAEDEDMDDPPAREARWSIRGETVAVHTTTQDGLRRYEARTTAALRDNLPPGQREEIAEQPSDPVTRTGNDLFDFLFALAVEETRRNSVSSIRDGAFNQGQGVPCSCFETGEKWNYVWTRDTAYAVHLGLAMLDPSRARRSLEFKLSERKTGGDLQIVQDTGTGGSWPVSTDRVSWSLGAWEVLQWLEGEERAAFRDKTLEALNNTIAHDRATIWDPSDGLYRGEQSFLDWREQTYPSWTARDTVHIGGSRSLSTNVVHLSALRVAARLSREIAQEEDAQRYEQMARDLSEAIHREFWQDDPGQWLALKGPDLDPSPVERLDLLGSSLAILGDLAETDAARSALDHYPNTNAGPPVVWPQQPFTRIYHNRGIWPFVTAYSLLAAQKTGHSPFFEHALTSLIHGAALHLSNMENFEMLSLRPYVEDGEYSGPVVNSRRQLWSVAGYLGAILRGIFGIQSTPEGLHIAPFLTSNLRNQWFEDTDTLSLRNFYYKGSSLDLALHLPPVDEEEESIFVVDRIEMDGEAVSLPLLDLPERASLDVFLSAGNAGRGHLKMAENPEDFRNLFAPREPSLTALVRQGNQVRLAFNASGEEGVQFAIYKNGERVADGLEENAWLDPVSVGRETSCYTVESVFPGSGHRSHHAPPLCDWGADFDRVQEVSIYAFSPPSGRNWSHEHGRPHYSNWGAPEDTLVLPSLEARSSGRHLLHFVYGNGAGSIETGITAAVKTLVVSRVDNGEEVLRKQVFMPHLANWERWGESSLVSVELEKGQEYRLALEDGTNMSYFAHFEPYTGGQGGGSEPYNRVNIASLKILAMEESPEPRSPAITLGTEDDLSAFPEEQRLSPGVPLGDTSHAAITWDEDFLYVAFRSDAFLDPYRPVQVYLESIQGTLPTAQPGRGQEYSGLRPHLPFTPTHLVTLRAQRDHGDASGPWNGIWVPNNGQWRPLSFLEREMHVSGNTLSARIPRHLLGDPNHLRLSAHIVHAQPGNEWKDTLPPQHEPWNPSNTGYYEIDLEGPARRADWLIQ